MTWRVPMGVKTKARRMGEQRRLADIVFDAMAALSRLIQKVKDYPVSANIVGITYYAV